MSLCLSQSACLCLPPTYLKFQPTSSNSFPLCRFLCFSGSFSSRWSLSLSPGFIQFASKLKCHSTLQHFLLIQICLEDRPTTQALKTTHTHTHTHTHTPVGPLSYTGLTSTYTNTRGQACTGMLVSGIRLHTCTPSCRTSWYTAGCLQWGHYIWKRKRCECFFERKRTS